MSVTYYIDSAKGVIFITLSGVVIYEDMLNCLNQIALDPAYNPNLHRLYNGTEVTSFEVSGRLWRSLANEILYTDNARGAMIAANDLTYGMMRMYELAGRSDRIRVFRNEVDAYNWLGLAHDGTKARDVTLSPPKAMASGSSF